MSNPIKFFAPFLLASVGMVVFVPVFAAEGDTASGSSIIACDYPDDAYMQNVCTPLRKEADDLLNGSAKAPSPVVMTQELNIDEYRLKGIDAIIKSTTGSDVVPSTGTTTDQPEVPWHL